MFRPLWYNRAVVRKKSPEELSVEELRWLLVEKRRLTRQERLERYRRTGRALVIAPDVDNSLQQMHTGVLDEGEVAVQVPRSPRRRILDGFLLLVEISAVLGFLFVLFNGLRLIQDLNKEVASALEQPTLTPTPLIVAIVLPSGHTPPNAEGGARPNEGALFIPEVRLVIFVDCKLLAGVLHLAQVDHAVVTVDE